MSTNNQPHVKFTKIYTDGYQKDFEFEDDVEGVLLVSGLLLGHDKNLLIFVSLKTCVCLHLFYALR